MKNLVIFSLSVLLVIVLTLYIEQGVELSQVLTPIMDCPGDQHVSNKQSQVSMERFPKQREELKRGH